MVEQNKNRGLLIGIAAASALVGAALLYHFFTSGEDGEEGSPIERELKAAGLDEVKKTPDGQMLDPKYMLKLLNFVTKTGKARRQEERDAALATRLELFKEKKDDLYRELVKDEFEKDDRMCQAVMQETMGCLDTSEQEFSITMQMMAQNPQMQQMMMAAQQGKLPDDEGKEE